MSNSSKLSNSKISVTVTKQNKLRSELRRVMSDRVLKITQCSKQQLHNSPADKAAINNASKTNVVAAKTQHSIVMSPNEESSKKIQSQKEEIDCLKELEDSPPLPADFDLRDKNKLVEHIKKIYSQCLSDEEAIFKAAKSIAKSIQKYSNLNKLDLKITMNQILKDFLYQTNIQLKQKYKQDDKTDLLVKNEAQLQVLLQIENYIVVNNKSKHIDDDWVWEIANTIRWLSQTFRDKFKIEKFLLCDIYANYHSISADFVVSLKEELGYDKEDDNEENLPESVLSEKGNLSSENSTPILVNKNLSRLLTDNQETEHISTSSPLINSRINNLFQDDYPTSSNTSTNINNFTNPNNTSCNSLSDTSNHNISNEDNHDVLNDLKKKKIVNRFNDFSSMRSIVVQKKRMRLKIRSPYKSPSKRLINTSSSDKKAMDQNPRRSPRIKIKTDKGESGDRKRKSYLITDTPDHKQKSTIITIRQENVKKRFSFEQFGLLPIIPDTPVKGETRSHNAVTPNKPASNMVMSARCSEILQCAQNTTPKKRSALFE